MKNLFLIAVFLLSVFSVNAQKELAAGNQYPGDERAQEVYQAAIDKQANAKTSAVRTTWLANKPNSNWFLSIKTGMGGVLSDKNVNIAAPWKWFKDRNGFWHPTGGLALGKWFSPVWGLRLDVDYGHVQSFDNNSITNGGSRYYAGTGNFLINLKNLFLPYNPKGFFNPVLNIGTGILHTNEDNGWNPIKEKGFYNVTEKIGLQLNFRLCDAWNFFIDGQTWLVNKNFDRNLKAHKIFGNTDVVLNGTLGFTYNFNFRHFIKAPMYDQAEIDALNREINELRNRPQVVCPPVVKCPDPVPATTVAPVEEKKEELSPVFFTIGSSAVRDNQLISVAKAAEYLINHPSSKLEVASYADKKTGTPSYNLQLSKKRSDAVADMLVNKFGIDKKRLVIKYYGDTVQPFTENDWNRVSIFILP
ncbi:MAG: OmpA family protein [Dysgonamonadaceae bacterium]|jgi:outer membrane protein OmpA-like peptidoglycan-associated protein|nr:OmpA family protein [Dysgonamonadaceae bacterium]